MTDAFLYNAIRTPIGRLNGALSGVRADDLASTPIKAPVDCNAGVDWAAIDDSILGCAKQAGEDNRSVARMAVLLAGPARTGARRDRQSAVRIGAQRSRYRRAGDPQRRCGADHFRRRQEHDGCALCDGQGERSVRSCPEAGGHDPRLALRQSGDGRPLMASIRCPRRARTKDDGSKRRTSLWLDSDVWHKKWRTLALVAR